MTLIIEDTGISLRTEEPEFVEATRYFTYTTQYTLLTQRNFIFDVLLDISIIEDVGISLKTEESPNIVGPINRNFIYDVGAAVSGQRNFIYDVIQVLIGQRNFIYDTHGILSVSRQFLYDTLGIVTFDRNVIYDTLLAVIGQKNFIYDTIRMPFGQRKFIYDTHAIVTFGRNFVYDTGISASGQRNFIFDTGLLVTDRQNFIYDTVLTAGARRNFIYDTILEVLGSRVFLYDTRGIFRYQRNFIYDVDRVLYRRAYFGGQIAVDGISVDPKNRRIAIRALGHMKELEQWPGYEISALLGDVFEIPGVTLRAYTESTTLPTILGPKVLSYKFKTGGSRRRKDNPISTLSVKSASIDTLPGIKLIEYDLWQDGFRWDGGAWTTLTEDTGDQTLTASDSTTLIVDIGKLPLQNCYGYITVLDALVQGSFQPSNYNGPGNLEFTFDNGRPVVFKHMFDEVIAYDKTADLFTDRSEEAQQPGRTSFTVLNETDDALYIGDSVPFNRCKFEISGSPSALTYTVEYSQGFGIWTAMSVTDDTSNFSANGDINWTIPNDWQPNVVDAGALGELTGSYWIRITCSTITGSLVLYAVQRPVTLIDSRGGELLLDIDVDKLPYEAAQGDIVLREDSSIVVQPCTWYQGITMSEAFDYILDKARYSTLRRLIDTPEIVLGTVEY